MTPLESVLRLGVEALDDMQVGFALVGGLAVSAWAEPRTTRDVDLAVAVEDDSQAEEVAFAMRLRGYEVVTVLDHLPTGRLGTIRLRTPGPLPVLTDLLFASSGIEPEIVAAAQRRTIVAGLEGPVACPGHLVAMKLLARNAERFQDSADLQVLRPVLDATDVELARTAVRLIAARGFHRDRDLTADLEAYLAAPPRDTQQLA